ncbi:response regulator transcription factor [Tenacibaculum maritimum]|nr:response regulator transcription factor [Tenacibaculum maritimum]MDB0602306.1 response regulator transcription factor [Tenacibaculum maritimum]MDB0612442.1 response regulator transcription factor [Tenacibaculum maritimum]
MNIHIADDYQLIIDGFRALLINDNINVVGTSCNGIELISWLKTNKADIVILDISMPLKNGIEVIDYLKENGINQKVIIVSGYLQLDFIKSTVGNGAKGFVSKQFAAISIVEALHKVYDGETYFSTDVQELLIQECLNFENNPNSEFSTSMLEKSLSKQEISILLLHAQKYNSKEISDELKISQSTIRSYRTRIREKLNISEVTGFSKRLAFLKGISIEK